MAGSLHQMTMTYVAEQDRLMFRVSTTDDIEYQMWFTRRFVGVLWGALRQTMERNPDLRDDMTRDVKDAILGMEHQEAVQQADFSQEHKKDNTNLTSNTGPLLVVGGAVTPGEGELTGIKFSTKDGTEVRFNLNKQLLHAFCHLMVSTAVRAEWSLDLSLGDANVVLPEAAVQQVH